MCAGWVGWVPSVFRLDPAAAAAAGTLFVLSIETFPPFRGVGWGLLVS